jgi:hypothetical protein
MVVEAHRLNRTSIQVSVKASPAGALAKPVKTALSEGDADALRPSYSQSLSSAGAAQAGRMMAAALLPAAVYERLYLSVGRAREAGARGLRLRLILDESLAPLPWELIQRPEVTSDSARSGFLLLDPFFSLARGPATSGAAFSTVRGAQRLLFLGAVHGDGSDIFDVATEFKALQKHTKPLGTWLVPFFRAAADFAGIGDVLAGGAGLFHYSGNAFVQDGRGYLVAHAQSTKEAIDTPTLGGALGRAGVRAAVLTASESHATPVVAPLLQAGVPVVIAFNGGQLTNEASIEFCGALYRALAAGLSIDESVAHGRGRLAELSLQHGSVDWGHIVLHMATESAVPFPREGDDVPVALQQKTRATHQETASHVEVLLEKLDGDDYGPLLSTLSERGVLIVGRFSDRRRKILEAIKAHLQKHAAGYRPVLFTFEKPKSRNLMESIALFAGLSRFVIADLTEPKSVPAELAAIVPHSPSVPVIAIASKTTREYPLFDSLRDYRSVIRDVVRYTSEADLLRRLDAEVVEAAEARRRDLLAHR